MTDKDFDKILKQKIESLPSGDVKGWSSLNQRIDKELGFDQVIREKLTQHQVGDVKGWAALSSKIDSEISTDQTSLEQSNFDQQIFSKLGGQQTNYLPESWNILEEKLDENEVLRKRLLLAGFLQFIAVFLILLSLWNWKGAEYIHDIKVRHQEEAQLEYAFDQMKESFYEQFFIDLNSRNTLLSQVSIVKDLPTTVKTKDVEQIEEINLASTTQSTQDGGLVERADDISFIQHSQTAVLHTSNQAITNEFNEDTDRTVSSLKTLQAKDIALLNLERAAPEKNPTLFFEQKKKKFITTLGIVFSPDVYLIRSPEDPIYPSPSYFTDSFGKSGGVTFSATHKDLEVETGILYSTVSYSPREINETYSSQGRFYETSLQNILFNVVTLPIQIKNHINIGKKSSFYFHAGASFNTIINSNFNIKNIAIAAPLNPLAPTGVNEPLLDQKVFEPGILEGGNIFDNAFATVDIGIGFQQMVVDRLSFYVQPSLSTQFSSGIGPNEDKLHKLSLNLGAKYQLN